MLFTSGIQSSRLQVFHQNSNVSLSVNFSTSIFPQTSFLVRFLIFFMILSFLLIFPQFVCDALHANHIFALIFTWLIAFKYSKSLLTYLSCIARIPKLKRPLSLPMVIFLLFSSFLKIFLDLFKIVILDFI
jgi:hypothetical protein